MGIEPRKDFVIRIYHFFYPIIGGIIYVLMIYIVFPHLFWKIGGILFLYLVPPAGKESMVPALVFVLSPVYGIWCILLAAIFITFIDSIVAWWTIWNWDLLKYIPLLGLYVKKLEEIGEEKWKKHRLIRKFAYAGLAAFVAIPFQGSGGLTASIIGRLLGMNEYKILLSVITGSFLGSAIIAVLTYFSLWSVKEWGTLALGGIVIFIGVIVVAYLWLRGEKNENNGNWRRRIHR